MKLSSSDFERLFQVFKIETEEHLQSLNTALVALEVVSEDSASEQKVEDRKQLDLIEEIFREAHSLKGAARMIEAQAIEGIAHQIESIFGQIKQGDRPLSTDVVDLMLMSFDAIAESVTTISAEGKEAAHPPEHLLLQLERLSQGLVPDFLGLSQKPEALEIVPPPSRLKKAHNTIRISSEKLDSLLAQTGELLTLKLKARQRLRDLQSLIDQNSQSIRENKRALMTLKNKRASRSFSDGQDRMDSSRSSGGRRAELIETKLHLVAQSEALMQLHQSLSDDFSQFSLITEKLQDEVRRTRLLPFQSVLDLFPRLVRDISKSVGKKVRLTMSGGEIELDKYILEEIKDPMMHLIRNCIDHGLEVEPVRLDSRKEAVGQLRIRISHKGHTAEIEISDDGTGIDLQRIRDVVLEKGLHAASALSHFTDEQVLNMIFYPGFSTREALSDISGRGIGMDVVKAKIEKLNGSIQIESHAAEGTRFVIRLPLRLSTTQSLKISVAGQPYFLPVNRVEKIVKVFEKDLQSVEGYAALSYEQSYIPYCRLSHLLTPSSQSSPDKILEQEQQEKTVAILKRGQTLAAFAMDAFLGEEEILMKGLGPYMKRVRNIAGVSIMRDGRIAPVLNVSDLMRSLDRSGQAAFDRGTQVKNAKAQYRVLVVDDSVMTRTLEKNILVAQGYEVITASNGTEAIAKLQASPIDIVVSDIQMPDMDGLALTDWIKKDPRFVHLPVILVTALESREDKKRGIEVGADAYILKSAFDQSTLLEVLERLLRSRIQ